jgi:hypothetical protein
MVVAVLGSDQAACGFEFSGKLVTQVAGVRGTIGGGL